VFEKRRFLVLIRYFIAFGDRGGGTLVKKMAEYHQYDAVNRAVESTVRAAGKGGDKRASVVWRTQGSGKSLKMALNAGRVVQHPAMENPTCVVVSEQNLLDDQLYGTFARRPMPPSLDSPEHPLSWKTRTPDIFPAAGLKKPDVSISCRTSSSRKSGACRTRT
jgi:hypothetical protein